MYIKTDGEDRARSTKECFVIMKALGTLTPSLP